MRSLVVAVFLASAALLAAPATALNNGMGVRPPLGWSTWCTGAPCGTDYCDEVMIREAAAAMQSNGMQKAGYNWVLLDDCWAGTSRAADGSITWDTGRFPSGIPSLISWLHKEGFSFGLYTSMGNTTCSSGGRGLPVPGSEHHYEADINTFASWGVDYVKGDWCGDVKKLPFDGLAVGAKDYKAMSHYITSSSPARPMYFEGVAAMIFLLGDVGTYVNGFRAATDHHDNWSNLLQIVATAEVVDIPGRSMAWADWDVLMTGGQGCANAHNTSQHCPGMTDTEYLSEFALWSIHQSPLIVSTDVRNMTGIMQYLLLNQRVLAIHQNIATPPGKHIGDDISCPLLECSFFTRPLSDGSVAAVLLNTGPGANAMRFNVTKELAWPAGQRYVVEDLYRGSTSPDTTGVYRATVASHGSNYIVFHPR